MQDRWNNKSLNCLQLCRQWENVRHFFHLFVAYFVNKTAQTAQVALEKATPIF